MFFRYDEPFNAWLKSDLTSDPPSHDSFRALLPTEVKTRMAVLILKNPSGAAWIVLLRNATESEPQYHSAVAQIKRKQGKYFDLQQEFRQLDGAKAKTILLAHADAS